MGSLDYLEPPADSSSPLTIRALTQALDSAETSDTNGNGNLVLPDGSPSPSNGNRNKNQEAEEAWRYARCTSLSHLGSCLRSDPEMSKAVLSMLAGDIVSTNGNDSTNNGSDIAPF